MNGECPENTQRVSPQVTSGRSGAQPHLSDISGPQMLYFTDEEPQHECIGNRRHFFGRPSLRGYKQNPFRAQTPGLLKEEVILQNPEAVAVLRKIGQ